MSEPHPEKASEEVDSDILGEEEKGHSTDSQLSRSRISASVKVAGFAGPIPPPSVLEQYNNIDPSINAADRIISMAEKEQAHRHEMQTKLVDAQITDFKQSRTERRIGQIFGFSIGVVSIVAGSLTAILGSAIAGTFIGSAGVVGLVSVFVLERRDQQNDQRLLSLDSSDIEDDEEDERSIS